ncbi:MAG TPA: VWA domain-containing protein [Kofleriaceae bacterium]|nr:VWA domain-containing protein [Kofleriaceae bacterium]
MKIRTRRIAFAWLLLVVVAAPIAWGIKVYLEDAERRQELDWHRPWAKWLALAGLLVAWVQFHLRAQRGATLGFTRVAAMKQARGDVVAYLAFLPAVLRIVAIGAIAIGLARPQTYRTVTYEQDSIDIMIVLDLSKSMEDTDMRRDRLDAAQRVVRRFVAGRKGDRVGLVVFAQRAMLQCPLTTDMHVVDRVVADLAIGDVPELGTAIGDGLGMALAYLRRSDAKSKVVVLLSDGDNNVSTQMTPQQAAQAAHDLSVQVFTVLVGTEGSVFGNAVDPSTLRSIASVTGGQFFEAKDTQALSASFDAVRERLEKNRRKHTERKKDKELFVPLVGLAFGLLVLELALSATRFRRFP